MDEGLIKEFWRLMEETVRRGGRALERLEDEYAVYIEMPGSWLRIP
jgi:hypothetical protein